MTSVISMAKVKDRAWQIRKLCKLLKISDEEAGGLALALDDPNRYLAKYAARLAERSVTEVVDELGELALMDALDASDAALILDWKFELDDATETIDDILGEDVIDWDDFDADEDGDGQEILDELAEHLLDQGYVLCQVGLDNDSFECFVIKKSKAKKALRLADALGLNAGSIEP